MNARETLVALADPKKKPPAVAAAEGVETPNS